MNKKEFLEKALESPFCPNKFEIIYKEFTFYQELSLDTLREIHKVCEKNNITYSISDGSMIGLIRNDGLIPWDYDIDIMVPLEEKGKLINALLTDLDKDYYFVCPEVDKHCRHYVIRVAPKGYRTEELHVDVFFFVGAPDDEEERKRIASRFIELVNHRYNRYVKIFENSYGRFKTMVHLFIKRLSSIPYSMKEEYKEYHSYADLFPYKKCKYALRADQFGWDKRFIKGHFRTFYSEDFLETFLYKSSIGEFRVFKGYDRILREIYGDYMIEPSIESCIYEVVEHHNHLMQSKNETLLN